jgi:surfeit locus 1 family protein
MRAREAGGGDERGDRDVSMVMLPSRRGLLWPTLFTFTGVAMLIGLGTWQIERRAWKDELIRTISVRSTAAPMRPEAWLELQCERADRVGLARSCDYTAVRLRGRFDHANERHVFASLSSQPGRDAGPGYWIFTPFRLAEHNAWTLVNRGFVPHDRKDAAKRADGQLSGEVEIVGLIRTGQVRGWFDGKNDKAGNVWYVRDPFELLEAGQAAAPFALDRRAIGGGPPDPLVFYIDQVAPVPKGGLPLPLAAGVQLQNRHLEYAITWYGLAAALIGVYLASAWSRLKGSRSAPFP